MFTVLNGLVCALRIFPQSILRAGTLFVSRSCQSLSTADKNNENYRPCCRLQVQCYRGGGIKVSAPSNKEKICFLSSVARSQYSVQCTYIKLESFSGVSGFPFSQFLPFGTVCLHATQSMNPTIDVKIYF